MKRHSLPIPILVLLVVLGGLVATIFVNRSEAEKADSREAEAALKEAAGTTPEPTQDYLLIGGPNMAGMAEIPEGGMEPIPGVLLLSEKDGWQPAHSPLNRFSSIDPKAADRLLGPGESFARTMLGEGKAAEIRLVVNAGDDSAIDKWLGKSELYWGARGRVRRAPGGVELKGILWVPGAEDAASAGGYAEKLGEFAGNLRSDFKQPNLPLVVAQVPGCPEINAEIEKFSKATHSTGFVPAGGLSVSAGMLLDAKSQKTLGERMAGEMLRIRAALPAPAKPPADIAFIDPHVHAMSVTPLGLRSVAAWMESRNVEQCIVSPLNHKGSRAWTEEERKAMLDNFLPYKGRIHRMCIIDAGEVATVDEAIAILKREKESGAVGFGEHYGRGLMFDDPKNLLLYEACEKAGLPAMFHIDQGKNMVTQGMPEVDRVLGKFPKCTVVAHGYWWRQLGNGACDRQLREHPNLYADMSGDVVVNVLNRDRKYAREFLIRNQDKVLWATDEGWWSFGNPQHQMNRHYTFLEELDLPDQVRRKIYRENAIKVYGLDESEH